MPKPKSKNYIAFQGELGANSHIAAQVVAPKFEPLPCATFADTLAAVRDKKADLLLIPVENTIAGRVADIHHLLPDAGLYIIGEHFMPIALALLGLPNAKASQLRHVYSHEMALRQCTKLIARQKLQPHVTADTAGAAHYIMQQNDVQNSALAPALAAKIYGLKILRSKAMDTTSNTTRFLLMASTPQDADPKERYVMTSLLFRVRNTPAALFKALAGFATNGVNMVKLESYQLDASFTSTQFYVDIEGHPAQEPVRRALEELQFFCSKLVILGAYPAHPYRRKAKRRG